MIYIDPMLLDTAAQPYSDKNSIFEPKIDGHRLILSKKDTVRLFTRNHNDVTNRYPELHDIPIDGDIILDGEAVCLNEYGLPCFELTMKRFSTKKEREVAALKKGLPVYYFVWDILHYRGKDLRFLPLIKRKEILDRVLPESEFIQKTMFIEAEGEALFKVIQSKGMEGVVGKEKNSVYVSRRSSSWKKVINWKSGTVYITGYRKKEFGWLAAVKEANGTFRNVGIIELGVSPIHKEAFRKVAQSIIVREDDTFIHLEPLIRAKVKYRNKTSNGMYRIPTFLEFAI